MKTTVHKIDGNVYIVAHVPIAENVFRRVVFRKVKSEKRALAILGVIDAAAFAKAR